MTQDVTADFIYMRLHGDKELYRSGYSDKSLDRWAQRIRAWQKGAEPADAEKISRKKPPSGKPRDVYCFFDNTDVKLRAPFDAQTLMSKLGIPPRAAAEPARKRAPAPAPTVPRAKPAVPRAKPAARVKPSVRAKLKPRRSAVSASRRRAATGSRQSTARSS
jgi:hypothetical protein